MPKTSKHRRQVPLKTGPFKSIQPRTQGAAALPRTQEVPPETMKRIEQLVAPGPFFTLPHNMALEDVREITARAFISGFVIIIPHDMVLGHNVGFAHNALQNVVITKPSGDGQTPEGSGGIRNDNITASLPNQGSPAWNAFNPSAPMQSMDTGAVPMAFDTSPSRPFGRRMVAVDLGADLPTEPFCAILDGAVKYSCMTVQGVARLADNQPNVVIRQTTPSQRQGQGYPTPAGMIVNPQRFVVLTLKAFDPDIPPVSVDMLIWEGSGPVADVEVYLGWQLFEKLQARKTQLKAGEIRGQTTEFFAMDRSMGQNGNPELSGNLPTVLQSNMSLTGAGNQPGPANAPYDEDYFPSNTSRLHLPFYKVGGGQTLDHSDLGSTQMTSIFSETPGSATTISSFDPTFAPVNTMAGIMKDSARDPFAGYDGAESESREDGPAHETINPAMLRIQSWN